MANTESTITISVVRFRPDDNSTLIDIALEGGNENPAGSGHMTDGKLTTIGNYLLRLNKSTSKDKHKVKFKVATAADNQDKGDEYQLVGIAFINRDLSDPDKACGQHVFTKIEKSGDFFSVTADRSAITAGGERYEFNLYLQRTRDCVVLKIDPEYELEN